jgi:hypothetical protein
MLRDWGPCRSICHRVGADTLVHQCLAQNPQPHLLLPLLFLASFLPLLVHACICASAAPALLTAPSSFLRVSCPPVHQLLPAIAWFWCAPVLGVIQRTKCDSAMTHGHYVVVHLRCFCLVARIQGIKCGCVVVLSRHACILLSALVLVPLGCGSHEDFLTESNLSIFFPY